jgi:hypothetical protein
MTSQQSQPKKQPNIPQKDNLLETLRDLSGGVGQTVKTDVVGKVATDALTSLFGGNPFDQTENRQFPRMPQREQESARPQAHVPEILQPHRLRDEQEKTKQEIEAIRQELKSLSASIKSFSKEVDKAVAEMPVNPGVYHLNFYERLRAVLMLLREQIDDSSAWLATSSSRKQKKSFWGKYKKHGTQFGLSSERTIATQAG